MVAPKPRKLGAIYGATSPPSKKAKPSPPTTKPFGGPEAKEEAWHDLTEEAEEEEEEFVEEAEEEEEDAQEVGDPVMMEILQDYQVSPTLIQAFFMNLSHHEQKSILRLG